MKPLLALWFALWCGLAAARLPAAVPDAERWQLQGAGEMRWFGFALYNARLWRKGERWQAGMPYALELSYRRNFSAEQLVDTSIDEMQRLGMRDEQRLKRWRSALAGVFPSVREGDVIIGLHEPGQGARFFYNGQPVGAPLEAELAAAFFAIWLDPRTRAPALRARLLADNESAGL